MHGERVGAGRSNRPRELTTMQAGMEAPDGSQRSLPLRHRSLPSGCGEDAPESFIDAALTAGQALLPELSPQRWLLSKGLLPEKWSGKHRGSICTGPPEQGPCAPSLWRRGAIQPP